MDRLYRTLAIGLLATTILLVVVSYAGGGIAYDLLSTNKTDQQRLESIESFFAGWGVAAPLVYVVIVTFEVVVAPIPGTLLYLPGGVIFGGFLGGLLALIGNTLGAGIACQLMRSIVGRRATESFFEHESLTAYRELIEQRGLLIIALLRVNPLTSSDLVSYAAGISTVSVRTVMLGTCLGMAPLCFAQSYLAETLFQRLPWLVYPLLAVCAGYVVVVAITIWRIGSSANTGD